MLLLLPVHDAYPKIAQLDLDWLIGMCAMQLAGYKVKCMLAEPKGKRTYMDSSWSDPASPLSQQVTCSPSPSLLVKNPARSSLCCLMTIQCMDLWET